MALAGVLIAYRCRASMACTADLVCTRERGHSLWRGVGGLGCSVMASGVDCIGFPLRGPFLTTDTQLMMPACVPASQ